VPHTSGLNRLYRDSASTNTVAQHPSAASIRIPPLNPAFSARSGPSWQQIAALLIIIVFLILLVWLMPVLARDLGYWSFWGLFMGNAVLRFFACLVPRGKTSPALAPVLDLPHYSVIIALYKEAKLVPQLLNAVLALDYPHDRLEILFALEEDDQETIAAFRSRYLPPFVHVIEVPDGMPRTKPRALNHALGLATGDLVVIYDAEDRPARDQLREAAAAFTADADGRLACVQAPLRPVGAHTFIGRQFAAEYAVQFDVLLPALNRLRLPFPLGGTSNHFRADILKAIGAWDAFNVTEDADLGLRLAQYGYTSGIIAAPTEETPPAFSRTWIPQRTRWIKGYIQTLLVHTRLNTPFRWRVWVGMVLGVALSAGAALCYAPFSLLVLTSLLTDLLQNTLYMMGAHGHPIKWQAWHMSPVAVSDIVLFAFGTVSATATLLVGTRRAGVRFGWRDVVSAPLYWSMQSIAAGFALYQLVTKPFHWDKTEHTPVEADTSPLPGR